MSNSQNRIFGYDLIKTIAIFMIVFYHLGGIDYGTIEPGKYFLPNFNKSLLSFCASSVPLFLMVHGALILPKRLNFKETIFKATNMILLLLFGKAILQHVVLEKCFCINEEMVHLWFLGTLGIVYMVSFFMNQLKLLRHIILLILIIYPFLSNLLYDCIVYYKPDFKNLSFGHDGFFTLYALVYFYLGYYLKDKTLPSYYYFLFILWGFFLINFEVVILSNHYQMSFDDVNGSFPTVGALFLSAGFYFLLKDTTTTSSIIRHLITVVGSNTMGVYLFHVVIIFLLRKYVHCDSLSLWTSAILSCSIIISLAIISHLVKNSYGKILRSYYQIK